MAGKNSPILLAVDGSPEAVKAAKYAVKLAGMLDRDILCIHVIASPPLARKLNPALIAHYFISAETQAKKWLADVEQLSRNIRIKTEIMIDAKSVPETIISTAKKEHAEMIIMGAKGRTFSKKLLLGSVAYSVSAQAECPVLLVR